MITSEGSRKVPLSPEQLRALDQIATDLAGLVQDRIKNDGVAWFCSEDVTQSRKLYPVVAEASNSFWRKVWAMVEVKVGQSCEKKEDLWRETDALKMLVDTSGQKEVTAAIRAEFERAYPNLTRAQIKSIVGIVTRRIRGWRPASGPRTKSPEPDEEDVLPPLPGMGEVQVVLKEVNRLQTRLSQLHEQEHRIELERKEIMETLEKYKPMIRAIEVLREASAKVKDAVQGPQ